MLYYVKARRATHWKLRLLGRNRLGISIWRLAMTDGFLSTPSIRPASLVLPGNGGGALPAVLQT
jgi:hypothetical protein